VAVREKGDFVLAVGGNSESGYTKNCSFCCFLGFVILCVVFVN
jgi:hypothetical protein